MCHRRGSPEEVPIYSLTYSYQNVGSKPKEVAAQLPPLFI